MACDRAFMEDLKRRADEIARLILREDYPAVDVEIARQRLREHVETAAPGKLSLYDMIYERRFDRLWMQFRPEE